MPLSVLNFVQGANSALEDVAVLSRCLEQAADEPAAAAAAFTAARAEDARALLTPNPNP